MTHAAASEYDVVVIGGGYAGVAAAWSAARSGARTLLVERASALGGNVSQAWVHTICGLFFNDREQAEYLSRGFAAEFTERLKRAGGAREPERMGRVFVVPTQPERMAEFCSSLCLELDLLDVWTGVRLVSADLARAPGEWNGLRLEYDQVTTEIVARVVIDASGDASLAALAGADLLPNGDEPPMASSLVFSVSGVRDSATRGFAPLRTSAAIASGVRSGALPAECDSVTVRPGATSGSAYLTLNIAPSTEVSFDLARQECVQTLTQSALARAEHVVRYLRETRPDFSEAQIERVPARVGVRETRRIAGEHVITEAHVLTGARSADDVALSSWPIELWSDYRRAKFQYPADVCGIPLAALRSRSCPELGMAGRCLSASRQALGALRVLGTALAMGEAIGTAAAIAVAQGISLSKVTSQSVRNAQMRRDL